MREAELVQAGLAVSLRKAEPVHAGSLTSLRKAGQVYSETAVLLTKSGLCRLQRDSGARFPVRFWYKRPVIRSKPDRLWSAARSASAAPLFLMSGPFNQIAAPPEAVLGNELRDQRREERRRRHG